MPHSTGPLAAPTSPELDVWRIDLRAEPLGGAVLDDADRAHVAQALSDDVRRRRIAARAGLRAILARYEEGRPLEFVLGPHGKPALARPDAVRFNVTHTDELMLLVVSGDREVGIDAEAPRPRRDVLALSRHALTEADREALATAPEAERHALFHRLWVRREAAVKCVGTGLAAGPEHPDVTVVDATIDEIPVAVAAAGPDPVVLRWLDA